MDFCTCGEKQEPALAIATVAIQPWEQMYDQQKALKEGTIFPSLNLPFYVTGGGKHA